jgi:hypothetical protein
MPQSRFLTFFFRFKQSLNAGRQPASAFPISSHRCSDLTLIRIAERGVMEILELVPSNSRRNTSKKTFERWRRGNKAEMRFLFISSSFPLAVVCRSKEEIEWKWTGLIGTDNCNYSVNYPTPVSILWRVLLSLNALSGDEVLDDSENPLLLVPGKFADFFKDTAGLADRTALALSAILPAKKVIH